jgi:hypothetical protein
LTQERSLLTQGERKAHVLFLLQKETRGEENKRKRGERHSDIELTNVIATELASISFSFTLKPKA